MLGRLPLLVPQQAAPKPFPAVALTDGPSPAVSTPACVSDTSPWRRQRYVDTPATTAAGAYGYHSLTDCDRCSSSPCCRARLYYL